MKHPHAEKMMQYAQDAMETDTPWERWEFCPGDDDCWLSLNDHPGWKASAYRRRSDKPVTKTVTAKCWFKPYYGSIYHSEKNPGNTWIRFPAGDITGEIEV